MIEMKKDLSSAPNIIECKDICKVYNLVGRSEKVVALQDITLYDDSEFYPIKKYISLLH